MASSLDGSGGHYAGELTGSQGVVAPFTYILDDGAYAGQVNLQGSATWTEAPENQLDQDFFLDPMAGKGQPPIVSASDPNLGRYPVTDCGPKACYLYGGAEASPRLLAEGYYYGANADGTANGKQVSLRPGTDGAVFQFTKSGTLGNYFFFGGMQTSAGNVVVNFVPGRYVLAGVLGGGSNPLFEISNGSYLTDRGPVASEQPGPGEIFIFSGADRTGRFTYPGLHEHAANVPAVAAIESQLLAGVSGFKMGANDDSYINLHGLRSDGSDPLPGETNSVGSSLSSFTPVVLWQDQANSGVKYLSNGEIDVSCGDINSPCTNGNLSSPLSPEMYLGANANINLYGAAYQPRGAWLTLGGNSPFSGPLQVITGALNLSGGASLTLQGVSRTVTRRIVALVE